MLQELEQLQLEQKEGTKREGQGISIVHNNPHDGEGSQRWGEDVDEGQGF